MDTSIGTWDNRGQLVAKPKTYQGVTFPDPSDPEWQFPVYMRYKPNGKVSSVPAWRGQELMYDPYKNWEQATEEDWREQEKAFAVADEAAALSGKSLHFDFHSQKEVDPTPVFRDSPQIQPEVQTQEQLPNPESSAILEAVQGTNEKLDRLTDAIIKLVENQPKKRPKAQQE